MNLPEQNTSTRPEPTVNIYPKITRSDLEAAVGRLAGDRGDVYTILQAHLSRGEDEKEQTPAPFIELLAQRRCVKDLIYTTAHTFPPASGAFPDELTNELHPLVSRPHWPQITDWTWKQLQPVLRLVSNFLTTRTTWDWYTHVATGEVKSEPGTTHRYVSSPRTPLTQAEKHQAVKAIFSHMEKVTQFFVDKTDGKFGQQGPIGALHLGSGNIHDQARSSIVLEKELIMALAKLRIQASRAEDVNIQTFRIAVTLLHEIAHAFDWAAHRFAAGLDAATREPAFRHHGSLCVVRECGIVYEQLMFGYSLSFKWLQSSATPDARPPNLAVFAVPDGSLREAYPQLVGNKSDSLEEDTSVVFPPSLWVQKWFLDSTWQRIEREGLDFMRDEASSLELRYRPRYPIANWGTVYVVMPGDKGVWSTCFPTAGPLASGPDCSVHIRVPAGQVLEELDFDSAWLETFGQLDVAALVERGRRPIKFPHRKIEGGWKRVKFLHDKRKDIDPVWKPVFDLPRKKRKLNTADHAHDQPIEGALLDSLEALKNLGIEDSAK